MSSTTDLSVDIIKDVMPKSIRPNITPELITLINSIIKDPEVGEDYREHILGFSDVMKGGLYRMEDYITAVKYTSYKLRGDSNIVAYIKTFPDRVARYKSNGTVDISPWVTSYGRSKLVNAILNKSMIPTHILNADIHQKAVNVLADLMLTATSEKVRSDSANSLLTHLKPPENTKIEIDMNVKQVDGISDLRQATLELIKAQKLSIESGQSTAQDVAHSSVILEGQLDTK